MRVAAVVLVTAAVCVAAVPSPFNRYNFPNTAGLAPFAARCVVCWPLGVRLGPGHSHQRFMTICRLTGSSSGLLVPVPSLV